jgi:hypothetical protein
MTEALEMVRAYARKGTTSRVMVASRPKFNFWPDGSTSPGTYGYQCYNLTYKAG